MWIADKAAKSSCADDKAAIVLENMFELDGKIFEPFNILVGLNVAIVLLTDQPEGRTGHNEVNGFGVVGFQNLETVAIDNSAEAFDGHLWGLNHENRQAQGATGGDRCPR